MHSLFKNSSTSDASKVSERNWATARVWLAIDGRGGQSTPESVVIKMLAASIKHRAQSSVPEKYQNSSQEKIQELAAGSVGHASVETNNCYGSFWPGRRISGLKSPTVPWHNTLKEDLDAEERDPERQTTFYSLDVAAIEREHARLKEEAQNYRLKVKTSPTFRDGKSENCSTFSYQMLRAGGINRLSPKCQALENGIFALTPNALGECIDDAKRKEEELYPETRHFRPQRSSNI